METPHVILKWKHIWDTSWKWKLGSKNISFLKLDRSTKQKIGQRGKIHKTDIWQKILMGTIGHRCQVQYRYQSFFFVFWGQVSQVFFILNEISREKEKRYSRSIEVKITESFQVLVAVWRHLLMETGRYQNTAILLKKEPILWKSVWISW